MSDSDIIIKKFSDFGNSMLPFVKNDIPTYLTVVGITIEPSTHTDEKKLEFLRYLLETKHLFEDENPQIVYTYRISIYNRVLSWKKHYFLYCQQTSRVIDFLSWTSESPIGYNHLFSLDSNLIERKNPYDPNTYASSNTPLVLWLAVRGVFVGRMERKPRENVDQFITRVFRKHKMDYGLSRKEAVGKAYAIAISTLQKKKYLKQGHRTATAAGLKRGDEIVSLYDKKDLNRYFLEFETMLKLSEGNRYAK